MYADVFVFQTRDKEKEWLQCDIIGKVFFVKQKEIEEISWEKKSNKVYYENTIYLQGGLILY